MKFRHIFLLAHVLLAVVLCSFGASALDNGISVYVEKNKIDFDTSPIIHDGRTMVPMRAVFEALGADIQWISQTNTVVATKGKKEISLTVGEKTLKSSENGMNKEITLDVPPFIRDERTFVPTRAVAEALGVSVEWLDEIKTVSISKEEREYVTLFDFNHNKKEIDKNFENQYLSIGFLKSIDDLYKTRYQQSTEAKIPLDTLLQNEKNGWTTEKTLLTLTENSTFSSKKGFFKVFWQPINSSGKNIKSYKFDVLYRTSKNTSFEKKTASVSLTVEKGKTMGITSNIPENCNVTFAGFPEIHTAFVGNVELTFFDGTEKSFWCGQELTNGDKWSGNIYGIDSTLTNCGQGNVIYNIFHIDGKTLETTYDEFLKICDKGWYLTPVKQFFATDGTAFIAAAKCESELIKDGFVTDPEKIKVKIFDTQSEDCKTAFVMPNEVYSYSLLGWKIYKEPILTVYLPDGSFKVIGKSELAKYVNSGWTENRSEVFTTVYAPDGRSAEITKIRLPEYLGSGWFETEVLTVWDTLGYAQVIEVLQKENYINNGYVTSPEGLYITLYHPDGTEKKVLPYEAEQLVLQGWNSQKQVYVYSENGEQLSIPETQLYEYLKNGWQTNPDLFYRDYYSSTGALRGLVMDEEKYIANDWRMIPYPFKINRATRLEKANVWSKYSYKFYFNPENVSGKTIESYKVEYFTLCDGKYFENYEIFNTCVLPNEKLCKGEFEDYFFVSLPSGTTEVIVGNITLEFEDGEILTFWCGQAVNLYDNEWSGKIYNSKFEVLPTDKNNDYMILAPQG